MDFKVEELLKTGFLDVYGRHEEATQFMMAIERFLSVTRLHGKEGSCYQDLVRIIAQETPFENCSVLLWDRRKSVLALKAAFGLGDLLHTGNERLYHKDLTFLAGEGIAGQVFATGQPVYIEDASLEPLPSKHNATVHPISLACLPLLDFGVLNVSGSRPYHFTPQHKHHWLFLSKVIGHLLEQTVYSESSAEVRGDYPVDSSHEVSAPRPAHETPGLPRHLFEEAFDLATQGICLLDADGLILRVNQSLERLQGVSAQDIVGLSPSLFFHDPQVFHTMMARARESAHQEITDVLLLNASGEAFKGDVHLVRLAGNDGLDGGFLLTVLDLTKTKALLEKSERKEKLAALGTMAAGVAHDFNNLLMSIMGNVQLALTRVEDEEVRRRLQGVEKAVYDGSHTVRRLQKFTAREPETHGVATVVAVGEAIADVVELTRPRWKNSMEKSGHLVEVIQEIEPHCYAAIHGSDFREILTNLVFNAIEAMPQGGTIWLRCRTAVDQVVVQIEDSGIGMSKEVMARVFDPFYTTKGVGNSGLGLSVCWSLVNKSGGEVQASSRPGKGSVFTILLPRGETPSQIQQAVHAGSRKESLRLLIVDDDEEVLGILRDMLRFKGYRVQATEDARKALEWIQEESFDLVLTDLGMPVVSGWEVAQHAKKKSPGVPVVLVTGWGAQYEEEDLKDKGVDAVLAKPLTWEKLLGTIEKMLN